MIKGYGENDETQNYFLKRGISLDNVNHNDYFYSLPIAMGNHLGDFSDDDTAKYIEAMIYGLESGINFIDTCINYRGMRSEKDVGTVLNEVINIKKSVKREEIIISSKCGGIFGDYTIGVRPMDYLNNILIPNGIVTKSDIHFIGDERHTLSPKFHKNAIEISKHNLNLETIDIQYIHNPEVDRFVLGEEEFYNQLSKLLVQYEKEVSNGHIRFYGMATWDAFLVEENSPWYISLEKVVSLVDSVCGPYNHFKFIQLPYNIYRQDAFAMKNQKVNNDLLSPIDAAKKLGLEITISSPLNEGKINNSTVSDMLSFVTNNKNIFSTMVGCKNKEHLNSNLHMYI